MNAPERAQQRKGLETRASKLRGDAAVIQQEISDAHDRLMKVEDQISAIEKQLRALEDKGPPTVTEHAMIQYLQRTGLVDFELLAEQILTPETVAMIAKLGNGKYPIPGTGLKAVVRDNAVVTVHD